MKKILISVMIMAAGAGSFFLISRDDPSKEPPPKPLISNAPAAISPPDPVPDPSKKALAFPAKDLPALPETLDEPKPGGLETEVKAQPGPEPLALTPEELEEIYLRAQVFRDEALTVFPLTSLSIHRPDSLARAETQESGGRISIGPPANEIWIRIKPENSNEMKEIMAQTADLYRQYVSEYDHPVRIVQWVGGRIWSAATYGRDNRVLVP